MVVYLLAVTRRAKDIFKAAVLVWVDRCLSTGRAYKVNLLEVSAEGSVDVDVVARGATLVLSRA